MKKAILALVLTVFVLPSCASLHAVKWAYGEPSVHDDAERAGSSFLRPAIGVPFILVSAAWDLVTWPEQLIFGVWPMWGDDSKHFVPPAH